MKRILIIAKCYKKDVSGPANIIRGLIRQFDKESINYKALLLEEGMDKVSYLEWFWWRHRPLNFCMVRLSNRPV